MSNWKWEPTARSKWDRVNVDAIPRYAEIEREFESQMIQTVNDFVSGKLERNDTVARFRASLETAQNDAFIAGRRIRKVAHGSVSQAEAEMLLGRARRQTAFFQRFLDDIDAGRGRMGYADRASLYAKSLWSVFLRGETVDWDGDEQNRRYYWILDPDAEHCQDCRDRAAYCRDHEDGYSFEQLVELGWPGDGTTRCMTNCRCHVLVKGAKQPRQRDTRDLEPAPTASQGWEELTRALGGPDFPDQIPASGLAHVRFDRSLIGASTAVAEDPTLLGRLAPIVPKLMAYPASVQSPSPNSKIFDGYGLRAVVDRNNSDGAWFIVLLLLLDQEKRREEREEARRGR